MAFMNLTADLITGNLHIDQQHQKLVDIVNQLHEAMKAGQGNQVLNAIFNELIAYTQYHFKAEEAMFNSVPYGQKLAHLKEHEDLIKQATDLQTKFKAGNSFVTVEVMTFLKNWVNNHILKMDMTYKGLI